MKRHISCFSIVVVILLLSGLNSEAQQISKTQLELRAKHNFVSENYESALSDFRLLYNNYPKNEEYCYFLGRCLLNTNRELEFAIELLKYSSIKGERTEAHYYLGEAYKKLYRLDDAYISLTTFMNAADKSEKKKLNPEYEMACIERMAISTTQGQFLEVLDKQEVQDVAFEKGYEQVVPGTIIHKPDEFTLEKDREMNYEGLMYLPENLENGNYIYFAGFGENKGGLQIFRVKKISDNEYTFPEPLSETINTDFDEEYPFFDYGSSTLYFSSKGHYSFGGYDIFKSSYDSLTDLWSKPEQLDFPINTPFDDYLYVINRKEGKAVLASNRESKTKKITVYTVKVEDTPHYIKLTQPDEKRELAMLDTPEPVVAVKDQEKEIPVERNYEDILFEALSYQSEADSLLILLREKRSKSINTDNENQRKVLLAEAGLLENQYRRAQDKANKMFEEANTVKPESAVVQKTDVTQNKEEDRNENIALKEERGDLKVYEFVASTASSTTASQPVKSDKLIIPPPKEDKKIRKKEFEILSYQPYNNANPIPKNAELPGGLVYRIQLGAFSNEVSADAFRGLFPVTAEVLHNNKITKYYVGYFSNSSDARNALEKVKEYGYPDAFLVPFYNSEKISINKAREIEFDQNKL